LVSVVLEMTHDEHEQEIRRHNLGIFAALGGIALTVLVQLSAAAWWAASQSTQMASIQARLASLEQQAVTETATKIAQADRLARLEEHVLELKSATADTRTHLVSIETYLADLRRNNTDRETLRGKK
jgi:septal ring factor EnvC (AmiA/AmiB activator)